MQYDRLFETRKDLQPLFDKYLEFKQKSILNKAADCLFKLLDKLVFEVPKPVRMSKIEIEMIDVVQRKLCRLLLTAINQEREWIFPYLERYISFCETIAADPGLIETDLDNRVFNRMEAYQILGIYFSPVHKTPQVPEVSNTAQEELDEDPLEFDTAQHLE